jgi:radical SAM protein with 4Fe4S-binding SPASM domain
MGRRGPGCAVWEITLKCNLKCLHCGSTAGKARSDELSTAEALQLCEDLKDIGCQGVALMGGEPLMRPDWQDIAVRVHELGMELSIITNGFALDKEVLRFIVEHQPESVAVSVDAGQASVHDRIRGVSGSFKRAQNAVNRLLNHGLATSVITTVSKLNLNELPAIRDWLLGKGIAWQIQMALPFGRLTQEHVLSKEEFYSLALFIASSQKHYQKKDLLVAGAHDMGYYARYLPDVQVNPWLGCQAGIVTLGIQSNGNILGCLALSDPFIEGNVRQRSLQDIWNDENSFSYARQVQKNDLGDNCKNCPFRSRCKGGCSAVSYSLTGKLHQGPYCLRIIEEEIFFE